MALTVYGKAWCAKMASTYQLRCRTVGQFGTVLVYSKLWLSGPHEIQTTFLVRPIFAGSKWYFPHDVIFDKTTSPIRPLLGSTEGGLKRGILQKKKNK